MSTGLTSNGYRLVDSPSRLGALEPVPASERTDRDALWARLRRDGYLFLTGLLEPGTVLDFRSYYFETLRGTGLLDPDRLPAEGHAGTGEVDRATLRKILFGTIVPGPEYERLCTLPRLHDWFTWFYDADVHLHRRKIIRHTQPGEAGVGTATQAHYDLVYLREGTDRVLSAWIPLGDVPLARGGLIYLEGSHLDTLAEEASLGGDVTRQRPARWITADLPSLAQRYERRWLVTDYHAGDVVVHTAYTIHAALDNVDPQGILRLSTDIRYQSAGDPIDLRWQHDWNPDDGL